MSDYTQITDFSAKDSLTAGDPEKKILGADLDAELAAIVTAIASKYDSGDSIAFTTAANVFTSGTQTISSTSSQLIYRVTDQVADEKDWRVRASVKTFRITSTNDAFTVERSILSAVRGTAAAISSIAIGNTTDNPTITLNGVASSDFAQKSQSNTFTGATQTISAGGAKYVVTDSAVTALLQADNGGSSAYVGTSTNTPLKFIANNVVVGSVTGAGVWTLNGVAASDFARLSQNNTLSKAGGNIQTFEATGDSAVRLLLKANGANRAYLGAPSTSSTLIVGAAQGDLELRIENGALYVSNDAGATANHKLTASNSTTTFNGVAVSDFARQSQANTFTANQAINKTSATNAYFSATADSSVAIFGVSDTSGGVTAGDSAGDAVVTGTSGFAVSANNGAATHFRINSSGNFDFKTGTLTRDSVDFTPYSGTFSGTLNSGLTTTPSGTVSYFRVGKQVTLWIDTSITGTSNSASLSMNGLPSVVQSSASRRVPCVAYDNGNNAMAGWCTVNGAGITFFLETSGSTIGSYTSSGTKGVPAGWTITYAI